MAFFLNKDEATPAVHPGKRYDSLLINVLHHIGQH